MTLRASCLLACLLLSMGLLSACEGQLTAEQDKSERDGSANTQEREPVSGDETINDGGGGAPGTGGHADRAVPSDVAADASASFPEGVPVFVASGHMGRTLVSCDDGKSWVHDQSADDSVRCFEDGFDCDHNGGAGTGLVYFDGWFIATFGWGAPGTIRRSQDGVAWQIVLDETSAGARSNFAGLMAGGDRIVAGARYPQISIDHGATWSEAGDTDLGDIYNVRTGGYSGFAGGRYAIHAEDNTHATRFSADGGKTWQAPTSIPAECGQNTLKLAGNASVLVLPARDGTVCSSSDGGDTWQASDLGASLESGALWANGQFMLWGDKDGEGRTVFVSQNGKDWTSAPGPDFAIGPVGYSPLSGSFVAANDNWRGWYEGQRFYRSADGLTWHELLGDKYTGGHPIRNIAFGTVPASAICP